MTRALRIGVSRLLSRSIGRRARTGLLAGAITTLVVVWVLSGVYQAPPDARAVVTRLGVVKGIVGPGLNYHLPWPLERAQVVAVGRINTLALGSAVADGSQSLTPTADGRLVDVAYSVHWRIADPIAYLFHVADPQGALKLSAQAAMREAIGAAPLAAATQADRGQLQRRMEAAIQHRMNDLGAGVIVTGVQLQSVSLPADVQAAAEDVVAARQDAQTSVEAAQVYRLRNLGEAKAAAAKMVIEAQSYREQTLREAQGAAVRFEQLDAAYRKAPRVTKDRLYFETVQGVLSRAHTVILDPAKGATFGLPADLLRASPQLPSGAPQATAQTPPPTSAPATPHGAKP
jgi:membrane protease subunit HflK